MVNGESQRVLAVATLTVEPAALAGALAVPRRRGAAVTLVVPATLRGWAWLADMDSAGEEAREFLPAASAALATAGLAVADAAVGLPDALAAVLDRTHAE